MEKARKAYLKIKKTIGLNNPCRLLKKLFDSLVTPILTNGREVWGVDSGVRPIIRQSDSPTVRWSNSPTVR